MTIIITNNVAAWKINKFIIILLKILHHPTLPLLPTTSSSSCIFQWNIIKCYEILCHGIFICYIYEICSIFLWYFYSCVTSYLWNWVQINIKSYANTNELAVMPQDRIARLEWDRRYLSVLGVENNRLYELRLQTPESTFLEEEDDLRRVMDSFRVFKAVLWIFGCCSRWVLPVSIPASKINQFISKIVSFCLFFSPVFMQDEGFFPHL